MARSDKKYAPSTGALPTAPFGTAKYHSENAMFWLRTTRYWKQAAWVSARNGNELRFNRSLHYYNHARGFCKRDLRLAREARAKMIEPVLG